MNKSDKIEEQAPEDEVARTDDPAGETAAQVPLAKAEADRDQLEQQLKRTLADLANFRKRRVQEMADARKAAVEALASELLPVLDNFHLAAGVQTVSGEDAVQAIREGLMMVRGMLEGVFERHGITEIQAGGETFDPAVHEAVGIDPDPDAAEGVVSQVLQRGYRIDGKILRPAKVMVGGSRETEGREDSEAE